MKQMSNLSILDRIILLIHTNRKRIGTAFAHFDYDEFEKQLIQKNKDIGKQ